MQKNEINRYGNLCVEMYEILHREAPSDELNFYLSYAQAGKKILEPLCGSGRFLVPFAQKGLDIFGVDSSREMLDKLQAKYPAAKFAFSTIENFQTEDKFDYIYNVGFDVPVHRYARVQKNRRQNQSPAESVREICFRRGRGSLPLQRRQ